MKNLWLLFKGCRFNQGNKRTTGELADCSWQLRPPGKITRYTCLIGCALLISMLCWVTVVQDGTSLKRQAKQSVNAIIFDCCLGGRWDNWSGTHLTLSTFQSWAIEHSDVWRSALTHHQDGRRTLTQMTGWHRWQHGLWGFWTVVVTLSGVVLLQHIYVTHTGFSFSLWSANNIICVAYKCHTNQRTWPRAQRQKWAVAL